LYECCLKIQKDAKTKRSEENLKFVFKNVIKHLKNSFFDSVKQNSINNHEDDHFYEFYFGKLAKEWSVSISHFYDPLNKKVNHKTLCNEYLNQVMCSTQFKTDFLKIIVSDTLQTEYQLSVPKKIKKLLKRFDDKFIYCTDDNLDKNIDFVRRYFRSNRQCKIPWTSKQINSAIGYAFQIFRHKIELID